MGFWILFNLFSSSKLGSSSRNTDQCRDVCDTGTSNEQLVMEWFCQCAVNGCGHRRSLRGTGTVFSASGFWGTVGNGALAGAGTGGVTALLNGDNFLKGLATGAVIGGAVAAVSYTVNYYAQGYNKTNYKTASSEIKSNDTPTYDINISRDTMQNDIDIMRSKNFTLSEMDQFGVGKDTLGYGGI